MSTKGSNNPFPSVLVVEEAAASVTSPDAGRQRLYIDSTTHKLKRKNSSGTSTDIEGGGGDVVGPASAVDARIAVFDGTTGKLIKDGGQTIAQVIAAGSGGAAMILLEQHTASSSASLDFTSSISSSYDEYLFEIIGIVPGTANANLLMRCSTDGGSTYDTANNYAYAFSLLSTGTFGTNNGNSGTSSIQLSGGIATTSGASVSGRATLYGPLSTSLHKVMPFQVGYQNSADGVRYSYSGSSWYLSTSAVDAVQFLMSSGNIASGTIRCYGLSK